MEAAGEAFVGTGWERLVDRRDANPRTNLGDAPKSVQAALNVD